MEVLKLSQGVTEVMMTRSLRTATTIVKICDCHAGQCDNPPGWQKNLQCLQHLAPAANSAAPGKKSFSPPFWPQKRVSISSRAKHYLPTDCAFSPQVSQPSNRNDECSDKNVVWRLHCCPCGVWVLFPLHWKGLFDLLIYSTVWQMFLSWWVCQWLDKYTGVDHIGVWYRWCPSAGRDTVVQHTNRLWSLSEGQKNLFGYVQHHCLNLESAYQWSALPPLLPTLQHILSSLPGVPPHPFPPIPNLCRWPPVSMVDAQLKRSGGQGHWSWQAAFTDLSVG